MIVNIIRQLRQQAGVTQRVLAEKAGTSQATIAAYEAGAKSPTLTTLQNLASSVGLELVASFVPPLTREDRRSLAYHRAIVASLGPETIARAKKNLKKMKSLHSGPKPLFDRWQSWLELPIEELKLRVLGSSLAARDMRQVSPFAGCLSGKERLRVLKQFRKTHS